MPRNDSRRADDGAAKASDLIDLTTGLSRGLLPIDHRKDRASEIRSRFHQLIGASVLKFVSAAIAPEHAKAAHSNRMGTGNIISAVPHHQTVRRQDIVLRQNMGEQFRLMIERAAWH
jgi:hypothetical protein